MIHHLRVSLAVVLLMVSSVVILQAQTRTRRSVSTAQKRRSAATQSSNPLVVGFLEAGNKAADAGNYDAAIAAYDQGLLLAREEPALFTNRSIALIDRGEASFNNFTTNKKASSKAAAFRDWRDAADASRKAVELLKTAKADANGPANQLLELKLAALSTRALAMRLVASKVDQSRAQEACTAFQEYFAAETDPAEKSKAALEASEIKLGPNKRCGVQP